MLMDSSKNWLVVSEVGEDGTVFYPVVGWDHLATDQALRDEGYPEHGWHPVVYQGSYVELFDDYSTVSDADSWSVRRCTVEEWTAVMEHYETVGHNRDQDADLLNFINRSNNRRHMMQRAVKKVREEPAGE